MAARASSRAAIEWHACSRRLFEDFARLQIFAGTGVGLAECVESAAACQPIAATGDIHRLERQAVIACRFFMSQQCIGALRGLLGVMDRARGIAARQRGPIVIGERGELIRRGIAMNLLDRAADLQMQPAATRRRDLVIQRLAEQRVPEVIAPGFVEGLDHARLQRLFERTDACVLLHVVDGADEQTDVEGASDHRCAGEHLIGEWRQTIQSLADHFADPFGNAARAADGQQGGRGSRSVGEHLLLNQKAGHLSDEERIAFGLAMDSFGKCERHRGAAGSQRHHANCLVVAQAGQAQALEALVPGQFTERARQGMLARQFDVAVSDEDQNPAERQVRGDEFEQAQRRSVCPMQVVHHEQQWLFRGSALPEAGHGVEETESRLGRVEDGQPRRAGGRVLLQVGQDLSQR